eukprot:93112_1
MSVMLLFLLSHILSVTLSQYCWPEPTPQPTSPTPSPSPSPSPAPIANHPSNPTNTPTLHTNEPTYNPSKTPTNKPIDKATTFSPTILDIINESTNIPSVLQHLNATSTSMPHEIIKQANNDSNNHISSYMFGVVVAIAIILCVVIVIILVIFKRKKNEYDHNMKQMNMTQIKPMNDGYIAPKLTEIKGNELDENGDVDGVDHIANNTKDMDIVHVIDSTAIGNDNEEHQTREDSDPVETKQLGETDHQ